ncbi:MAG: sugar isomerase domain-containing protein [Terriglobales bacterium]
MIETYQREITGVLNRLWQTQTPNLRRAAEWMADAIAAGGLVHVYGSGHSVLPVMDIFPRYGSYAGFHPMMDSRLMWFSVLDAGGVHELLWLERKEGYAKIFLETQDLAPGDVMLLFSHGGINAAAIDVALEAQARGLKTVCVTSMDNARRQAATHSSGQKLADACDLAIDNCVPAEDALVAVEGVAGKVGAGSTVAVITIAMALVSEVAAQLRARGVTPRPFVSPNVKEVGPENNAQVFAEYRQRRAHHAARARGSAV